MADPEPGSDQFVPFRRADGKLEVLETSHERRGAAVAVYNDGTVVGHTGALGFGAVGAIWRDDSVTLLYGSPDAASTHAASVNAHGVAAGAQNIPGKDGGGAPAHAVIWVHDNLVPIEYEKCASEWATSNADTGQVVGLCRATSDPVLWNNLQPFRLVELVVYPEQIWVFEPVAIHNDGRILLDVDVDSEDIQILGASAILMPIASPPSDVNHDCITDSADLLLLLEQWNQTDSYADVDGNGIVNVFDLLELLVNWG